MSRAAVRRADGAEKRRDMAAGFVFGVLSWCRPSGYHHSNEGGQLPFGREEARGRLLRRR